MYSVVKSQKVAFASDLLKRKKERQHAHIW